uniref:Uncharacterized protein n=1 Tax=Romanomermis culicivorax TaxID=13658 RepID=A0A915KYK2_ROMCU
MEPLLNIQNGCRAPFTDPGTLFIGEPYCKKLFAIRAFCRWKCSVDCAMSSVQKIACPKPVIFGSGDTPDQIMASCVCFGQSLKGKWVNSDCVITWRPSHFGAGVTFAPCLTLAPKEVRNEYV